MSDRLTTVEEKIAYLEQFVGELDGVVRELHDSLAAVRREMGQLRGQLEQAAQDGPDAPDAPDGPDTTDDLEAHKPPHY
jgi:uncharacterized coiled-coil protein SlyX